MRVQVAGRQLDVGEALRTRIQEELDAGVSKYFSRAVDALVTVGKKGVGYEVDCALHLASGISLQAQGHAGDPHTAFSSALDKIETRVRRYKRRLKNHHKGASEPLPAGDASSYVLAPYETEDEDTPDGAYENGAAPEAASESAHEAPLVIAETKIPVRTMTVSMAVLQLDLAESPALMFRNAAHGGLNVVYRRADGNIGWIDPAPAPS
ncbi:MAG: ribosome-associated translation inhibitor RaiA [Hyphomonadaceae bacterium]